MRLDKHLSTNNRSGFKAVNALCSGRCLTLSALPSRKNVKASAVCRYSLSAVQEAFQGPYMEMQGTRLEWKDYAGKIPEPRPGTVNTRAQDEIQK